MHSLNSPTRRRLGIMTTDERREMVEGKNGNGNGNGHAEAKVEAPQPIQITTAPVETPPPSETDSVRLVDAPLCYNCGNQMRPAGSCFVCESCGSTSGCS